MAWRIISSKKVDHDFGKILLRVYAEGRLRPTLEAMKYLRGKFAADPMEAGEPKHRLKHLGLLLCVATRRPLLIHYAVDEQRQWVYLRRITLLAD